MTDIFSSISLSPKDPVLGLTGDFLEDPRAEKMNLLVGLYKAQGGRPYLMPSVAQALRRAATEAEHKEYLPVLGDATFCSSLAEVIFGKKIPGVQTLGGTGALFAAGLFLRDQGVKEILIPEPTWPNHRRIFSDLQAFECSLVSVICPKTQRVDWSLLSKSLRSTKNAWLLLDACCHNPTGVDPSAQQLRELFSICREQGHGILFDMAYYGLGEGPEKDTLAIDLSQQCGLRTLVAVSCSKTFTLYSERLGALYALGLGEGAGAQELSRWLDRMSYLLRAVYSNPPSHGAQALRLLLTDPSLFPQWQEELSQARKRLCSLRNALIEVFSALGVQSLEQALKEQRGLFGFLSLNAQQVEQLRSERGIYLVEGGRLNLSALSLEEMDHLARAIVKVL